MKRIFFIFCLLGINFLLFATDVSGNQSGTWDLAGSPYNIVGDITIPAGEILIIEPGVDVIATGDYKITALGNMEAEGTYSDSIRFYGENGTNWGGILLENEIIMSYFSRCRISDTSGDDNYPIRSINSPVCLNYCRICYHQNGLSLSATTSIDPPIMELYQTRIYSIQRSGVTITDNSNAVIDNCYIYECGLGTDVYGAIRLLLVDETHSCSPTICNNHIQHNEKAGISLVNYYQYDGMDPLISDNNICYNYSGIEVYNADGMFIWNCIYNNFETNNADSGTGIKIIGEAANPVFKYNSIHNNYVGVHLSDGATANFGDLNNASPDDDGYNCLYDNISCTGEEITIYNASAEDVTAENNVWDDDPSIPTTIIDGNDNPAYGIVDYEPTLTPYAPPKEINVVVNGNGVIVSVPCFTAYPTYLYPYLINIFQDGSFVGCMTSSIYVIPFISNGAHTFGASFVYEGDYESTITDTTIYIGYIHNPPSNVGYELFPDHIHLYWEPPVGNNVDVQEYHIYVDGVMYTTTELYYDIYDVVAGQEYEIALTVLYVDNVESDPVVFNILFTDSDDVLTAESQLLGNYPNPFNPSTTISFTLCNVRKEPYELIIYNLKGQKVKTFSNQQITQLSNQQIAKSTNHQIVWDGTDQSGQPVSSGIYFYRLITKDQVFSRKMLMMK
jgi:hypothetical protein